MVLHLVVLDEVTGPVGVELLPALPSFPERVGFTRRRWCGALSETLKQVALIGIASYLVEGLGEANANGREGFVGCT
jgi:hypothetical protein